MYFSIKYSFGCAKYFLWIFFYQNDFLEYFHTFLKFNVVSTAVMQFVAVFCDCEIDASKWLK